jgi:putative aldouronate transport system permease protein
LTRLGHRLRRDWQLYLLLLLPVAFVFIFKYAAYPGLRIAFMNYKPARGFAGSEWVGFGIFEKIFRDADFLRALKNSLMFNFLDLLIGFPVPILLALLLNELRFRRFKRLSQTILYLPHFLSWVIIASVSYQVFRPDTGLLNVVMKDAGMIDSGIPFLTEKNHWAVTYLLMAVWQNMGWGSIIYLAAMTGISPELYEAATVDGAGRLRRIWHVTLPGIKATMVTLLILNLGRIMGSNFERLSAFGNVNVREYQYQLAIYIYEKGLAGGNFSNATAVGLFQSLAGFLLVLFADRFAKSMGESGLI